MIIKDEELHDALNAKDFSATVEEHLRAGKFESYLTAIVDLANELDLEDKDIVRLLSPTLKDKIKLEAEADGMLFKEQNPMMKFD